jgi:hypothetical protein
MQQGIHNDIVALLGSGDVERGWLLFGALDGSARAYLEREYRAGTLSDRDVSEYTALAAVKIGSKSSEPGATQ